MRRASSKVGTLGKVGLLLGLSGVGKQSEPNSDKCVALARRPMKKVLEELSARRLASSHNARAVSRPSLSMSWGVIEITKVRATEVIIAIIDG
jgi:hypothetical protein